MKLSLCVALVHNNNEDRNTYIRKSIDRLCHQIEHTCNLDKIEVSFQAVTKPHSDLMSFLRDLMYLKLSHNWRQYRLLNPLRSFYNLAGFLKRSLARYIFARQTTGQRWKKNSAIEVAVTDKHIRAWTQFLDTNADWLICFEDDAVFKEDSINNIEKLLSHLGNINCHKPIYIDLAGGCNLEDIQISKLLEKQDEYFRYYKKPVTNTACVYMMNRSLVYQFYSILTIKPWLRLIGVDWMMNNLFIHINDLVSTPDSGVVCMHADPTIFKHGTTTGDYVSWQANDLKSELRKL